MQDEYNERVRTCDLKNSQLQNTAESMRLSILGKDSKTKDDKPLGVVDAYVKENTTELVDPLDIKIRMFRSYHFCIFIEYPFHISS